MTEVVARSLTKTFGRVTAVRDISFTAPAGTITGFLGPNGSGKLSDPEVLLLDESANGLDPAGIAWLRGLLRRLAAEGRTIVLASHLLSEITQMVDHVLIVSAGELRFAGPLREIGETNEALESGRWLPFYASESLDRASVTSASGLLPQWGGGLVLLAYAAAFAGAAVLITLKRDVT